MKYSSKFKVNNHEKVRCHEWTEKKLSVSFSIFCTRRQENPAQFFEARLILFDSVNQNKDGQNFMNEENKQKGYDIYLGCFIAITYINLGYEITCTF